MATKNDLASIINVSFFEKHWTKEVESMKLPETHAYSVFYANCWGTSMETEEQTWLQKLGVEQRIWLQDHARNISKGHFGQAAVDVDANDAVAIDSDGENEADLDLGGDFGDEDYMPGCYALDLGIFKPPVIWIRAEYIRIFNATMDYFENGDARIVPKPPVVVLTGQPGIGKTVWLYYTLRRCLAERRAVILYKSSEECFLFVNDGVYQIPPEFSSNHDFKQPVVVLLDSRDFGTGLPRHIVDRNSKLWPIYATSPNASRWDKLHQGLRRLVLVMNPWSFWEIRQAAPLNRPDAKIDYNVIQELYQRLGPTPRVCIEFPSLEGSLKEYEHTLTSDINNMDPAKFQSAISCVRNLDKSDVGHKLFLIRRKQLALNADYVVEPITEHVSSRLSARVEKYSRAAQVRLLGLLYPERSARSMVGILFKPFGQSTFEETISLELYPMIHLDNEPTAAPTRQQTAQPTQWDHWHSSHKSFRNANLEESRQRALEEKVTLNVKPISTTRYNEHDKQLEISPNILYRPKSSNQVALDSFIAHDSSLYIFQFTASLKHTLKEGLVPFLAECQNLPSRDKWFFIFVIKDDVPVLKCSLPSEELQGIKLFSATLNVVA